MMQKVHLRRTKRLHRGHLWIFSNELFESPKDYAPGSFVSVHDMHDVFIGIGYINYHSLISIRLLTRKNEPVDRDFLKRRLSEAVSLRGRVSGSRDAYRVVYSEGDYLPGLIVDRYGECVVIQFLTSGMESVKDIVIGLVDEMLRPDVIVIRNESRMRNLEGLPLYREVVKGKLDTFPVIREEGVLFEIDPYEGQKTGFFLDQRDNRVRLPKYIRQGKGLDLFSYIGAWSMHLASAGAEVTCVDVSERAIAQTNRNAELNGLAERVSCVCEDVFAFLERDLQGGERKYDFIVLDPPAFVKSAGRLKEAMKAYREVNALSMRLLKTGGILATSSCSYHLGRALFTEMLQDASRTSQRDVRL
ncbi:MAG TPA: class I SAM-dependent rRNA methyltransferase, partial [Thermodesulfovibrionales bacterium]|nr:class I SAM-dependent rRNA methyltransferase [Thermodesulfovibrionales bacterium]